MESVSLSASPRTDFGKGAARKVRRSGGLPAVIYSKGGAAHSVTVDPKELDAIFRKSMNRNTLVSIDAGGATHTCLIKEVQRHPVSRVMRHVDFHAVDPDVAVAVTVKLVPTGTARGIKMGGKLRPMIRDLKIIAKPGDIPATIKVDVTELNIGEFIRVSEIPAPDGVRVLFKNDFNVMTVAGKRTADEGAKTEEVAS